MANLDDLATEQERGRQAEALLAHPVLREMFENVRAEARAAWEGSAPDAVQEREDAYQLMRALELLERRLKTTSQNGKLAERTVKQALSKLDRR
jgi:hypothetical protein